MDKKEEIKPKAKVIEPKKKRTLTKNTKKEVKKELNTEEIKQQTKDVIDKTTDVIKDEVAVAADKISKVAKIASEKMSNVANEIKEDNKETKIVTTETMWRVVVALILVAIIWVAFQVFSLVFEIGKNMFDDKDWVESRTEAYVDSFGSNMMYDDVDCDFKHKYKGGYILKCELDSLELMNKFADKEVYVGIMKYRDNSIDYCVPSSSKSEIKKCLKEK